MSTRKIALNIMLACCLVLELKYKEKVANKYEINVAIADPVIPYKGISIKFRITFITIPIPVL